MGGGSVPSNPPPPRALTTPTDARARRAVQDFVGGAASLASKEEVEALGVPYALAISELAEVFIVVIRTISTIIVIIVIIIIIIVIIELAEVSSSDMGGGSERA